jgi:hypothetical protein
MLHGVANGAQVVIACCRAEPEGLPSELYPDPDSEALLDALRQRGHPAVLAAWDDPGMDWATVPLVVIRSTWDSVDRSREFLRWVAYVSQRAVLINPAPVVAWGLDKSYLAELQAAGAQVVPTTWVRPGEPWSPPAGDFVIKPSVSAGGRETAWYGPEGAEAAAAHVERLTTEGATVMVQPHLAAVDERGELSVVFIEGEFSHAFRGGPLLARGAGVMDRPWEHQTVLGPDRPRQADLAAATHALGLVQGRFRDVLAYARVDLIDGPDGHPLVSEVEMVDPYLGLTLDPAALERFAGAIARRAPSAQSGPL